MLQHKILYNYNIKIVCRKGFLVSRMLVAAIHNSKAEELYGHLEPGQILKLDTLAQTLQIIANTPEDGRYIVAISHLICFAIFI